MMACGWPAGWLVAAHAAGRLAFDHLSPQCDGPPTPAASENNRKNADRGKAGTIEIALRSQGTARLRARGLSACRDAKLSAM
jgi:hypothetical protein